MSRIMFVLPIAFATFAFGFTSSPALAAHPSDFQLKNAGDRSGAWCATYNARSSSRSFGTGPELLFYNCFNSRAQCRSWYRQVSAKYPASTTTRRCSRR